MAVALDAVAAAGNNGDTQEYSASTGGSSTPITVGASASILVVAVNFKVAISQTTSRAVTWNGTSMTEVAYILNTAAGTECALYTLVSPASGAKTLSVTWTNSADAYIGAVSFTGSSTSATNGITAADTQQVNTGSSLTMTTASGDATVVSFVTNGSEPTTGKTKFWGESNLNPGGAGSYALSTTSSDAHTFTGAGGTSPALCGIHIPVASASGGFLKRNYWWDNV